MSFQSNDSVTSSYPFELVEAILLHLSVPDLLIAAANVPRFWSGVIESSTDLRKKILSHPHAEADRPWRMRKWIPPGLSSRSSTFRLPVKDGVLLIHRRNAEDEGYVLVTGSESSKVRVLDPKPHGVLFSDGRWDVRGLVTWFDLDGRLACSKVVDYDNIHLLRRYVQRVDDERQAESDDEVPPTKRRKT